MVLERFDTIPCSLNIRAVLTYPGSLRKEIEENPVSFSSHKKPTKPTQPLQNSQSVIEEVDLYMKAVDYARSVNQPDLSRCSYHGNIMQHSLNTHRKTSPMARFVAQDVSEQPALFKEINGPRLSTSKPCNCGEGIIAKESENAQL